MSQDHSAPPQSYEEMLAHINAQTGKLQWAELARHFARGVVICVTVDLDLVEVAIAVAQDRVDEIAAWTDAGRMRRANDEDARDWHERNSQFWSVVVAPWVLVQEITQQDQSF